MNGSANRRLNDAHEPGVQLTGKQRRRLRALGHHLHPVVMVGREGASDPVVAQVERELDAHELIKIRVLDASREDLRHVGEILSSRTGAHVAQLLGHTALLYRARADNPQLSLD